MSSIYQTNFTVVSQDGSEKIELRNPASSGKKLELLKIGVVSDADFAVFGVRRYDALATHDSPTAVEEYEFDPSSASPVGAAFYGPPESITFGGTVDFVHDEQLKGAGNVDAQIIFAKDLPGDEQVVILEGCSVQLILPPGQADWTIKFVWREIAL